MTPPGGLLPRWYVEYGRHDLPWRSTRERWQVLVSEVMLQQTQVARIVVAWPTFMQRFPTPTSMATASVGEVVRLWGRLGYPRRARRLWESAQVIATLGWPTDLTELPGVGTYTAAAVHALCDDGDVVAIDVNLRRVAERFTGTRLTDGAAEATLRHIGRGLPPRDRLLAIMDLGAQCCTARNPTCGACPLRRRCASKGARPDERRQRQAPFSGSFRQRRGNVLTVLRSGPAAVAELDEPALASLVTDGLAAIRKVRGIPTASLPEE